MKRSMFSKERADKLPNPPSLIGRLASEKENHSRHVKQLSTHNNNLQNSNEQQQTQTDELTKQLCALRNQTETQARQLLTMKKMLGFIADEKKFEQAKVEAAKSKISKLESKLGLSIGNTGLGKKNAEVSERSKRAFWKNGFRRLKPLLSKLTPLFVWLSRFTRFARLSLKMRLALLGAASQPHQRLVQQFQVAERKVNGPRGRAGQGRQRN